MKQQKMFPEPKPDWSDKQGLQPLDWGEISEIFDPIREHVKNRVLFTENEAQTRFDIIDRIVKDVLGWQHGQINVEEPISGERYGFIDYILSSGDYAIVIEAKRIGASFPNPTKKRQLKLTGSVLGEGDIKQAIEQAEYYALGKNADIVIVTNGLCWIYYDPQSRNDDSYASLLFPFTRAGDAEKLFQLFAAQSVANDSLHAITNLVPIVENRLIRIVKNADGRVDRNNIADFILEALNRALFKNVIVADYESLQRCFVATEARTRFDNTLQMYITHVKPDSISPAEKIDRAKSPGQLEGIIHRSLPSASPPVTLIIGPVGVGKTTYLKHFELVAGAQTLLSNRVHWIYIDFAEMGVGQSPRKFIYKKLLDYVESTNHPNSPTDWENLIRPAYEDLINALAQGQYYEFFKKQKDKFWEKVTERIERDSVEVEPFINRLFHYLAHHQLCFVILDNVDLFNESLETVIFSEGLAFSETTHVNVIITIRDTTFVRHQSDATFDAYQLRKLWLNPPDFKQVLSARLNYSKKILENRTAKIPTKNGMYVDVPDLSVFFNVIHRSLLNQKGGDFIEYMSNGNVRKGLELVTDFLTSGHVPGDTAIRNYLDGDYSFRFQFYEIFRGAILGQWRYFQEAKSPHCLNIFDARLNSEKLRLLRLHLIKFLWLQSRIGEGGTKIDECYKTFSKVGASQNHVVNCLKDLQKYGLVNTVSADTISFDSVIVLTATGGYYLQLASNFDYIDACLFDTAISHEDTWQEMMSITQSIEIQYDIYERIKDRAKRANLFLKYLGELERNIIVSLPNWDKISAIPEIIKQLNEQTSSIIRTIKSN